jgi:hypothetical protein
MVGFYVSVAVMAAVASGCGASTTTPSAQSSLSIPPVATTAPPVATTAPASSPATGSTPTPKPSPTPVASVDPKAPASVYGTESAGSEVHPSTWADTEGGRQARGYEETVILTVSDPRANGMAYVRINYDYYETGPGTEVATMWGDMRLDAPGDGTWEGPCTGSIWEYSHFTWVCWLSGSGPYEGMTFFYNLDHGPEQDDLVVRGHIYPGSVPSTGE